MCLGLGASYLDRHHFFYVSNETETVPYLKKTPTYSFASTLSTPHIPNTDYPPPMKFIISTLTLAACLAVGAAATENEFWSTVASQVAAMRAKTEIMASKSNNSSHSKVGKVNRSMRRREAFLEGYFRWLNPTVTLMYSGEKRNDSETTRRSRTNM